MSDVEHAARVPTIQRHEAACRHMEKRYARRVHFAEEDTSEAPPQTGPSISKSLFSLCGKR